VPLQLELLDLIALFVRILPESTLYDESQRPVLISLFRSTAMVACQMAPAPLPGFVVDEHVRQEGQLVLARMMARLNKFVDFKDACVVGPCKAVSGYFAGIILHVLYLSVHRSWCGGWRAWANRTCQTARL
jgi:hypothetical protein